MTHPQNSFYNLSIDQLFRVAESCGFEPTGEYFQLNSYENRVFDLFLESATQKRLICKVYRPGRWAKEAIQEEHDFMAELLEQGIPAVAPKKIDGATIIEDGGLYFSFFPKARGRMPQEFSSSDIQSLGRQLARLHTVGAQKKAHYRPTLDLDWFGWDSLDILEEWVAPEVWHRYEDASCQIIEFLEDHIDDHGFIRIHGDCHRGNILQTDPVNGQKELFFVDFDDIINGLPVQDFWMLFSSDESQNSDELQQFLKGYEELRLFDDRQLQLMPAFRGLRIIYYAAWIARRWQDPSFPRLFPLFTDYTYWAEEVEAIEKIAWALD